MTSRHPLARLARLAAARPWATLAVLTVLAAAGGALALGLQPATGADTLVGKGSSSARATAEYHRRFGDDAVVILVRERLPDLVDTADLGRLINLEGCLGGNIPSGRKPFGAAGGPCWQLAAHHPVKTVYGPGTFLNEATNQVAAQLSARIKAGEVNAGTAAAAARALAAKRGYGPAAQAKYAQQARQLARTKYLTSLSQLAVSTGVQGLPQIDNAAFINQIVFDAQRGADVPKARFAYLFPGKNAAIIQVRLRPGLSERAKRDAIGWIRGAIHVRNPATGRELFKLARGGSYTVTGVPVVVQDLAERVSGAMGLLLAAALVVMALTLALVFRARLKLLPLLVALAAAGMTFGVLRLVGATLTLATVAVLPVLIGLAVDYAVQFQSRVAEVGDVARAAAAGGPTIAIAGVATAVGFAVLVLSPVPMVRGFGLVLILGVALALGCAFAGGAAVLQLAGRRRPGRLDAALAASRRGAADIVGALPGVRRVGRGAAGGRRRALAYAVARPERVLAVGAVLALAGWAADTQTSVVSDVTKLVPQDSRALRDVRTLERATGISGEVDVLVRGANLTRPATVRWMASYQKGLLARFGYSEARGCRAATLCPSLSLSDLFQNTTPGTTAEVDRLLAAVPRYFSQAVISADHTRANLAFGIPLMPLSEQEKVISVMRDRLHPPAGVRAALAGLPVEAADANAALTSPWRRLGTLLVGLLAVGAGLWLMFRCLRRAVVPLIPIALATGWAALLVAPISLNPMSATLGALVIAIATEFSVLLSERYREERGRGHGMRAALDRSYRSTGAAILASGLTAIAGFGVLVLSDIALLRNFGWVTVLDLAVALGGVLLVLPAVLVLEERGELATLPRRALAALRPRRRRAPTAA